MFRRDSIDALEELGRMVIADPAEEKAVILAGDICHYDKIGGLALDHIAKFIDDLYTAGVIVYFIQGNHDWNEKAILDSQGAEHIHKKVIDIGGYSVYGLDGGTVEDIREALSDIEEKGDKIDLLVLHQPFKHLLNIEGAYDLSVMDIPENVKITVSGDIHHINKKDLGNDRVFLSSGSLHPCKVDEDYEHGAWVINTETDEISFSTIRTRRVERVEIASEDDLSEVVPLLKELQQDTYKTPVVEIKYLDSLQSKVELLMQEYKENIYYITDKVVLEEEKALELSEGRIDSTLIDKLGDAVDKEKDPKLYSFLEKVIKENPARIKVSIEELIAEMGGDFIEEGI